jgi:restriction system protein
MRRDQEERENVPAWVSASPGTGKTHILIQRIVRLLLDGTDPSRIGYFGSTAAEVENFRERISRGLTRLLNATDKELEQEIRQVTSENLHQQLIDRMRSRTEAALDFGKTGISVERVGTFPPNWRTFDHILVDHPEQLDEEQWKVFHDLSEVGLRSIFLVGDDKQSIFSFRGDDKSLPMLDLFGSLQRKLQSRGFSVTEASDLLSAVDAVFSKEASNSPLLVGSLVIPERKTAEGLLIKSTSVGWMEIAERLKNDWSIAYQIPPEKWEEMIAGAYSRAGFDEVILTPRSGDHGRDIIAILRGIGCIKIIGSVKAYKPGKLVRYDDVRALAGVLLGERDASKGIITTTSDFPPKILSDPVIAPLTPTRLELMNGMQLQKWLATLLATK